MADTRLSGGAGNRMSGRCDCGGRLVVWQEADPDRIRAEHTATNGVVTGRTWDGRAPLDGEEVAAELRRWYLTVLHPEYGDTAREGQAMVEGAGASASALRNKNICVTGKVAGYTRDELGAAIARAGGQLHDGVGPYTNLLVVGERPGAIKLREAIRQNLPRMTADWLLRALEAARTAQLAERRAGAAGTARRALNDASPAIRATAARLAVAGAPETYAVYQTPQEVPTPSAVEIDDLGVVWISQGGRRVGRMAAGVNMAEVMMPRGAPPALAVPAPASVARVARPTPVAAVAPAAPAPSLRERERERRGRRDE